MNRENRNVASPKRSIKQLLYQQKVSTGRNIQIVQIPQQDVQPQIKPERTIIEIPELPENKINRLHVVLTCVNYNDFLIVSLTENIKIIDPKFITVVTDSNDILTKQICDVFGVNCVVTDRFYENGAVFNKGKGLNEGINSVVDPEWILLTDADIIFPSDFLNILNAKIVNKNKLYAASRYLCRNYNTFEKNKNGEITLEQMDGVHRCPPVGYFQLFSINHPNLTKDQPIYPENSGDASWSDMLFADKFPQKECIQTLKLIHLGDDSQNWKGRKTKRFITDDVFTNLILTQKAYPFIPSIRKKQNNNKLAVITSFFNPANYENIKLNYTKFKEFISNAGVELYTAELVFDDQEFFTEESNFNLHIRGNQNNIMWQKERLLNLVLDIVPKDYNNIAWIDCDVIFDNPNWVNEINEKLQTYKILQLFEVGNFYDKNNKIERTSDGIIKHLHTLKINTGVDFHPLYGGSPGLAWAIRRECIENIKFVEKQIIGGGDAVMMLASIGCFNDQFIYQNMNSKLLTQTLVWSNKFYQEIKNSIFYVSGNAYHLYHGTNLKRNYNNRMEFLNNNDYNPILDIKLDENKLWKWDSDKPNLHNSVKQYFFDRDEDDNLKNLNYYFDGIFCINLDRSVEKWKLVTERFKKNNINVERVRGFDGNWDIVKNEWGNIHKQLVSKYGNKMLNPSANGLLENQYAYGTLCSHISIINLAKQRNLKRILIFEDDVAFHKNFNQQLIKLNKFKNWKLFYLGATQHNWNGITPKDEYYTPKCSLGGFAYALDSSIFDEVIELASRHEKSFDNCLGNFDGLDIQSKYPEDCYVIYPNLVIADVRTSDLRGNRDQNEHAVKMKYDLNSYDLI